MKNTAAKNQPITPATVARRAAAMPWKKNARVDLFPYEKAIVALRERGYSYNEIATWLAEQIGAPVKRGQVYYVCQILAGETHEQFEDADARGKVRYLPEVKLTAEEAERAAGEMDEKTASGSKKKGGAK